MLRCASVVVSVSTISSLTKCDRICIPCCIRFLVPFKLSWFMNAEFNLLFQGKMNYNLKMLRQQWLMSIL